MLAPICFECGSSMRCAKNGHLVKRLPGLHVSGFICECDRYHCTHCDKSVLIGFGKRIPYKDSDPLSRRTEEVTILIER